MDGDFAQPSVGLTWGARNIGGNPLIASLMQHNFTNVDAHAAGKVQRESSQRASGAELFCSKSICRVVFGEGGREEEEETLAARAREE